MRALLAMAAVSVLCAGPAHAKCRSAMDTSRSCDPNEFLSFYANPSYYLHDRAALRAQLLVCQTPVSHPRGWCEAARQAAKIVGSP